MVDHRGVGDQAAGQAAHLGQCGRAPVQSHPHQVEGSPGPPVPGQGAGVALRAVPVVEEPRRSEGDHAIPSIRLAVEGPVGHRVVGVGKEAAAVPSHAQQTGVPDHEDLVAAGREPGDRGLGQDATVHDGQRLGVQHHQLAGLALLRGDRCARARTGEVLGHEVAVVEEDEPVVGAWAGQGGGGGDRQAGRQSMGMVAEHDVERPVGMDGQAAGPGGPSDQVGRARHLVEGDRIDALDEGDGVVSGRVP